jgi:hypothetical protein
MYISLIPTGSPNIKCQNKEENKDQQGRGNVHSQTFIFLLLNSCFLIYAFQWITDLSVKLSKYNFTLFNDETTFFKIFPMWYLNFIFADNSDNVRLFKENQS